MSEENRTGGISFFGLLTIVFIVLKLTGFINWKWWIVLAPLWGSIALSLVLALVGAILEWFHYKNNH